MDPLLEILFGALVTGGAAWWGARVGVRRFKEERAYEQRVEWHRKALGVAHRLQELLDQRSRDADTKREIERLAKRVSRLSIESKVFSSEMTYYLLRHAVRGFDIADSRLRELDEEQSTDVDAWVDAEIERRNAAQRAVETLLSSLGDLLPDTDGPNLRQLLMTRWKLATLRFRKPGPFQRALRRLGSEDPPGPPGEGL